MRNVVAVRTLREFWQKHPDAEAPLRAWYQGAIDSDWATPRDVLVSYGTADILPGNRVVFNILGNRYRLVAKIHYNTRVVFIRFVGTRAEYDRIDALTV